MVRPPSHHRGTTCDATVEGEVEMQSSHHQGRTCKATVEGEVEV